MRVQAGAWVVLADWLRRSARFQLLRAALRRPLSSAGRDAHNLARAPPTTSTPGLYPCANTYPIPAINTCQSHSLPTPTLFAGEEPLAQRGRPLRRAAAVLRHHWWVLAGVGYCRVLTGLICLAIQVQTVPFVAKELVWHGCMLMSGRPAQSAPRPHQWAAALYYLAGTASLVLLTAILQNRPGTPCCQHPTGTSSTRPSNALRLVFPALSNPCPPSHMCRGELLHRPVRRLPLHRRAVPGAQHGAAQHSTPDRRAQRAWPARSALQRACASCRAKRVPQHVLLPAAAWMPFPLLPGLLLSQHTVGSLLACLSHHVCTHTAFTRSLPNPTICSPLNLLLHPHPPPAGHLVARAGPAHRAPQVPDHGRHSVQGVRPVRWWLGCWVAALGEALAPCGRQDALAGRAGGRETDKVGS